MAENLREGQRGGRDDSGTFDPYENHPIPAAARDPKIEIRGNGTIKCSWKDHSGNIQASGVQRHARVVDYWRVSFIPETSANIATPENTKRAFDKSEVLGTVQSDGLGRRISFTISDTGLETGYFFVVGVGEGGQFGPPTQPILYDAADTVNDRVPDDINTFSLTMKPIQQDRTTNVEITITFRNPQPLGSFAGVQLYMGPRKSDSVGGYLGSKEIVEVDGLIRGRGAEGAMSTGKIVLERDPNAASNPVTFYFVSVSKSGTRRPDIENSPGLLISGGIDALYATFFSVPNVTTLTAFIVGHAVSLAWFDVGTANASAAAVDRYLVFRTSNGTSQSAPGSPAKPAEPIATVMRELKAGTTANGRYLDDLFLIGTGDADPNSRGDFDPTNLARYRWWVQSVTTNGEKSISPPFVDLLIHGTPGNVIDPNATSRGAFTNKLWNAEWFITAGGAGSFIGNGDTQKASPPTGYEGWDNADSTPVRETQWVVSGSPNAGEVNMLGCNNGEASLVSMRILKSKFRQRDASTGERVVFSCQFKSAGSQSGGMQFGFGGLRVNGTTPVGSSSFASFGSTLMTSAYQRFFAYITLQHGGTYTHQRMIFGKRDGSAFDGNSRMAEPMVSQGSELSAWTAAMDTAGVPGDGGGPILTENPGGPSNCFLAGTPVLTPTGWKRIEDVIPGDLVLSVSGYGLLVSSRVQELVTGEADKFVILGSYDRQIVCTPNHPIGFVRLKNSPTIQYASADKFLDGRRKLVQYAGVHGEDTIYAKSSMMGGMSGVKWPVFNLHLAGPHHNYFANGLLVHNVKPIQA